MERQGSSVERRLMSGLVILRDRETAQRGINIELHLIGHIEAALAIRQKNLQWPLKS